MHHFGYIYWYLLEVLGGDLHIPTSKDTDNGIAFIDDGNMMQVLLLHDIKRLPVYRVITNGDRRSRHITFNLHHSFLENDQRKLFFHTENTALLTWINREYFSWLLICVKY
jgi:hypothetical protein